MPCGWTKADTVMVGVVPPSVDRTPRYRLVIALCGTPSVNFARAVRFAARTVRVASTSGEARVSSVDWTSANAYVPPAKAAAVG